MYDVQHRLATLRLLAVSSATSMRRARRTRLGHIGRRPPSFAVEFVDLYRHQRRLDESVAEAADVPSVFDR